MSVSIVVRPGTDTSSPSVRVRIEGYPPGSAGETWREIALVFPVGSTVDEMRSRIRAEVMAFLAIYPLDGVDVVALPTGLLGLSQLDI